jgi:hypothetical protein
MDGFKLSKIGKKTVTRNQVLKVYSEWFKEKIVKNSRRFFLNRPESLINYYFFFFNHA